MVRSITAAIFLVLMLLPHSLGAQQTVKYKSFDRFSNLVPDIDFFAAKREPITPYIEPATKAIEKLNALLGNDLPKGAIFICSTLEQKDSIYEPMVLKMGYGWTLTLETSDMSAQAMLARMKSMMGDNIPKEIMERMKSRPPDAMGAADNRMVSATIRRIAYAVIQTSFDKNLRFRSSRLDDMGKSPLPDWLDIGIAAYVSGEDPNVTYLQQNMEQTFPIEDVLTMSRPFVASTSSQGGNGVSGGMPGSRGGNNGGFGGGMTQGGFPAGGFGGMSQGGPSAAGFGGMSQGGRGQGSSGGGAGGQRAGGGQRTIPKDEQDQMLFDGQSSTFFAYLLDKVGIEKIAELIRSVQEGTEGRDFVSRPDVLGADFGAIEEAWTEWVKTLKPPQRPNPPGL